MQISKKLVAITLVAALITSGASVYAATTLDFSDKASAWTQTNCTEKQLSQKKPDINDAVCHNFQLTTTNTSDLTQQKNQIQTLSTQQSSEAAELTQQQDKIQALTTQLATYQKAPPADFAFFTNYAIKYGDYKPSPIYDADLYSKYSMTFTCTSNTNDKIKYWIETSTDKVNWSPQGYYEVNCNGSYGGASLNEGSTSARYYQIVVFPLTVNNNTNTINSFARFRN
jgi:hypothetical protein